ncbi:T-cell surface glycoprotein CD3 zeta chain [Astyanax mexicanus]|uniref:T-cell surface glycoprotein CD3 zeta chain n=1 Tax=Astyanax mexicanus TaxID=7994 RepID=A0A8B9K077_ASTMX|nr:T-cell surface glycoprotein CD3 zeta chain [Astyanax mexicanus]
MALQKTGVLVFVILMVSPAEAQDVLYDPRFCYFLDLFLLIYGIIITGMFLRERCFKSKQQKDIVYEDLKGGRATYDKLKQRDVEGGQGRRNRRDPEDTYTRLQKKTDDTYKEITVKKDRGRNDQVYQGLSAATKDTYDSLHMQPLPPRR